MNIGIDLDETISEMPQFFSIITKALRNSGNYIYILTFRDDKEEAERDLKEYEVEYECLFVPGTEDTDAAKWKAKLAAELELGLMIDDSPEVLSALPPKCKRMWLCDREVFDLKACIKVLKDSRKLATVK